MNLNRISQVIGLATTIEKTNEEDAKMGRMNANNIFDTAREAASKCGINNPDDLEDIDPVTLNSDMEASIEAAHKMVKGSMISPSQSACLADIELQLIAIDDPDASANNQQNAMDNIRWFLGQPGFIKPEIADVAKKSLQWVVESNKCMVYLKERYSQILE